ncbi:DUF5677 domain-containing protein [Sphingopyxis soli]|nr:DUF5677 domain-containing protein [Sphingopyxis soli]
MTRKKKSNRKKWSSGTRLEDHKRDKNTLFSRMSRLPAVTLSSWRDERLPEMLWAAILTARLNRENYLNIFRAIADAASGMKDLKWDGIGHSRLASLTEAEFDALLGPILNDETLSILSPLSLYPDIPDAKHWARHLKNWGEPDPEDYSIVGMAIGLNSWHQSETATDIRWARVLSMVLAAKVIFQPEMKHLVDEIVGYPDVGDLRKVRPSIRAMEQSFGAPELQAEATQQGSWTENFWTQSKRETECYLLPRNIVSSADHSEISRQIISCYRALAKHFNDQESYVVADARLDASFGIAFYMIQLLATMIHGRSGSRLEGRIILRTMAECHIVLSYLKEIDADATWAQYRNYGTGQAKLAFLKIVDLDSKDLPSFVKKDDLEELANEDRWLEFVDIDLGSWAKMSLRDMSERAKKKDIYDKYYGWASGYVHGHWSAVRDTVFDLCGNPLHRFHRIPGPPRINMADATPDAVKLTNLTLDLVNALYPSFKPRIKIS